MADFLEMWWKCSSNIGGREFDLHIEAKGEPWLWKQINNTKDLYFKQFLRTYEMDKVKDGDRFDYVAGYGKLMDIISTELQRRALIRDRQAAARRPDQVFKNTMRELGMNPDGTNITPSAPGPTKPKDDRKSADAKKKAEDKKKADD